MRLTVCAIFMAAVSLRAQVDPVRQKETALGAQLAAETARTTTAFDSAAASDYIDRIGRRLAGAIRGTPYRYSFAWVLDDRGGFTHEPLSLPGGYIFVPARLLAAGHDEAEFAAMLAHAMAHVEAHPYAQGAFVSCGWPGERPIAVPLSCLETAQSNEREADALAARIMSDAGYDPEALARYIRRTQKPTKEVFSPLPAAASRIDVIQNEIARLPHPTYASPSGEFFAVRAAVVEALRP